MTSITPDSGPPGETSRRRRAAQRVVPYVLAASLAVVLVVVTVVRQDNPATAEVLGDEQLKIMAPADPGGGWDQTSREMQSALQDLVGRSEVYNVGGAGGTIGLSQFVQLGDQPSQLMTTGLIMLGAIAANDAPNDLGETTPLVRLTTDSQVIVVPAESDIQTLDDLVAAMQEDLPAVSFAGGSAGGVEQILAGLLAQETGGDPSEVNYIAHSGGGEAVATLLSGSATAGISGISEIEPQIAAGTVRPLAVSSAERVGVIEDVPTLIEEGLDVELTNWRGVVAPAGISAEEEAALEELLMDMTETPEWRDALEAYGWGDVALAGPEFEDFVESETRRVDGVIADLGLGAGS